MRKVLLEKKKRCSSVKNAFPSAHIDIPKGTPWQNVDYVKKEGKWKNTEKSEFFGQHSFTVSICTFAPPHKLDGTPPLPVLLMRNKEAQRS